MTAPETVLPRISKEVRFNEIFPDPSNGRHQRDPDEDDKLERLMKKHGDESVMEICKREEGGYWPLDGHRRYDIYVKWGYKDSNPPIPCLLVHPADDPEGILTEIQRRRYRFRKQTTDLKWTEYDYWMEAFQLAEDEKRQTGRPYYEFAEEHGWHEKDFTAIRSVLQDPTLSKALKVGDSLLSMYEAMRLVNVPREAQETIIERKEEFTHKQIRELAKLTRAGTSVASAIESVTTLEEETTETPQELPVDEEEGEEKGLEEAPSSSETEITVEDEAAELVAPGGQSETVGEEEHSPQQNAAPLTSSSTPGQEFGREIISGKKPEREAEPQEEKPDGSESEDEPPLETEKKDISQSELAMCKAFETVKTRLQKYAKKPSSMLTNQFKTIANRNTILNTLGEIETHARTVRLKIESESNGRSHSCCAVIDIVNRVKDAEGHTSAILSGEVKVANSNLNEGIAVFNRMKEKIEQDAMSRR